MRAALGAPPEREKHMCKVFAGQNPQGYKSINRSIRIGGHSTSIQLESVFWELLDEIAQSQNLTTPKFISTLYSEAIEINGEIHNFASMLRSTCALYLSGHRPAAEEMYFVGTNGAGAVSPSAHPA
jgi:predicted DNA-binding ribbon-helix-helix protein